MTEPGWYNDERDASLARWHDGTGWTPHTVRKADWVGSEPPAPLSVPTPPATASAWQPRPAPTPPPTPSRTPPPRQALASRWRTNVRGRLRPRWARVVALAVVGGLLLVVVQHSPLGDWPVVEQLLGRGGSGDEAYEAEWHTLDGSSYHLTVKPSSKPRNDVSPEGCLPAPADGHANLGFEVRIENLSGRPAPMPEVSFAVNASEGGQLDRSPEAEAGANRAIEVTPRGPGVPCDDAAAIRPTGRAEIAKGKTVTLHGTVGGIVTPVPDGLALLVRYIQVDELNPKQAGTASFRAPFPKDEG